jgi:hypothetical protein
MKIVYGAGGSKVNDSIAGPAYTLLFTHLDSKEKPAITADFK